MSEVTPENYEFIPRIPYRAAPESLLRIFLCHAAVLVGLVIMLAAASNHLSGRASDAFVVIVLLIFLNVGFRLAIRIAVAAEENLRIRFEDVSERYRIMYYAPKWDHALAAEYRRLSYKMWRNNLGSKRFKSRY